jgi:DNA uptake protein ComE-like DNA-binding protein
LDLVQGWRRIEKDANVGTEIININTAWKQKLMKVPEI